MIPTLIGARVTLRALDEGDTDALFALFSDPVAMRYWSCPPFTERAQAQAYLAMQNDAPESALAWGVVHRADDALIGTCTLYAIDRGNGRAELGYMLSRAHWGKGLAREAATLAIDYAFTTLGLRRLEADIDPRNTASQKLLERLGFQKEGHLRERWQVAGEISDTTFYGLLAREWNAL